MILCLAAAGCQSSVGPTAAERISPVRLEYIEEFKRIDRAGKGRITLEEATAYYSVRFTELDKNRDGFLDVAELENILPAMGAKSGKELPPKLDRNGRQQGEPLGVSGHHELAVRVRQQPDGVGLG